MTPDEPPDTQPLMVHGLLVCRNAELAGEGRLNLEEVLEIVALDHLPGDAGPLTFVAFVRNLPAGKGQCAFVIHPAGQPEHITARLPLEFEVPDAYVSRQVALQMRMPQVPIAQGGWFDVAFEWEGRVLAVNRFAIGAKHGSE